jgi:NADPH:quinone reductase-like Zn-dependent oxidoreductase
VTVSASSAEAYAAELGADHVVVAAELEPGELSGFDAAIDAVGADVPEWLYASVRRGGRLVVLQEPPDAALAEQYGVDAKFFIVSTRHSKLEELAALLEQGRVKVAITRTFSLADGRAAYESGSQRGRRPGKTLISVS